MRRNVRQPTSRIVAALWRQARLKYALWEHSGLLAGEQARRTVWKKAFTTQGRTRRRGGAGGADLDTEAARKRIVITDNFLSRVWLSG
jgi:hypothetical protein